MNKAIFAKPNIPKLKKQGLACIDMHCHSRYSDGLSNINSIYKKCKKLGIGIAITDHNEVKGALKIAKYKNFLGIPGIETNSSEGIHTLFYFYNPNELEEFHKKFISKNYSKNPFSDLKASIFEIVENAKRYNCKISASHPFAPWNTGIYKFANKKEFKKLLKKFDFIEGINASNLHSANLNSIKWGNKINKQFTGGSDAHATIFIGKTITATNAKTREEFLDNLKRKSIVVGKEVNPLLLSLRHALKWRMFSKFPKFYIKKAIKIITK